MCDKRGDHQMRVRYLVCKNQECNAEESTDETPPRGPGRPRKVTKALNEDND